MAVEKKRKLSERAYESIKNSIVKGDVAPGDILSESQLAQEMQMSRTPVREALRALSTEGLVEVRNGVGACVKTFSSRDIEDLYEVRCVLELRAIRTSIYRIPIEEVNELEKSFREILESEKPEKTCSNGEFSDLDWRLHSALVHYCTNKYIKTIIASNDENLQRCLSISMNALGDARESANQHLEILKYVRERDLIGLEKVLQEHLEWSAALAHQYA